MARTKTAQQGETPAVANTRKKPTRRKLVAHRYILYRSRQFAPGEEIPVDDQTMIELWIKAGSARWIEAEE